MARVLRRMMTYLKFAWLKICRERELLVKHYSDGSSKARLMRPTVFPPGWRQMREYRESHLYIDGEDSRIIESPPYKPNRDGGIVEESDADG